MRRRRNPDYLNIALLGAIGVGLYMLYQAFTKLPAAVPKALETASSKTADWLEQVFPHGNTSFVPNSSIVLDDGTEIPATAPPQSSIGSFTATDGSTQIQFYWKGKTYQTVSATPDGSNTYYALCVSGCG